MREYIFILCWYFELLGADEFVNIWKWMLSYFAFHSLNLFDIVLDGLAITSEIIFADPEEFSCVGVGSGLALLMIVLSWVPVCSPGSNTSIDRHIKERENLAYITLKFLI